MVVLTIINLILLLAMFIYFTIQIQKLRQELWQMKQPLLSAQIPAEPVKTFDKPVTKPMTTVISTTQYPKKPNQIFDALKRIFKHLFFTPLGLAKIGASILLIGLVFLAKLMDDYGYFPLSVRMLSLAVVAVGLFVLGIVLSKKRRQYASLLMGVGFATAFLTIFVSNYLFNLITTPIAVTLQILISMICIVAAMYFRHKILTLVGLLGAFLATLSFTGYQPPTVFLLLYYCILNLLIFVLVLLCRWVRLAWLGLIASLLVGWYWYDETTPYLSQAEIFIAVTFLIYLSLSLQLLKLAEKNRLKIISLHAVNPVLSLSLQYTLLFHHSYLLAGVTGIMTLLYGGLYVLTKRVYWLSQLMLRQTHLILASLFFALTFTSLFSFHITGFIWALQSTLLIYFGLKHQNTIATYIGVIQQFLLLIYLTLLFYPIQNQQSYLWLGSGIVTFGLVVFSSYFFDILKNIMTKTLFSLLNRINFVLANIYLFYVVTDWAFRYIHASYLGFTFLIGIAIYSLFYLSFYKRLRWPFSELIIYSTPVLYVLINIYIVMADPQKLVPLGLVISYACTLAFYYFNELNENRKLFLAILIWTIFLTIILQCWNALLINLKWSMNYLFISLLLTTALCLWITVLVQRFRNISIGKPNLLTYTVSYPFALLLSILLIVVNPFLGPDVAPWRYNIVINPLDLSVLIGMITFIGIRQLTLMPIHKQSLGLFWLVLFVVANSIIVRSMMHGQMITYTFYNFIESSSIQITLTALWSIVGFTLVVLAIIKKSKLLKISGVSLIFIILAKLFFVDFSQLHPLLRIAAFVGVGALLLALGYITKTDRHD